MNKGTMYTNVNTEKSTLMAYLPLRLPGRTDWRESRSAVPKTRFSFFIFQRRIIQILPMNRGANPDEWAATIPPCPTLLWTFNQRSPHLLPPSPPSLCPDASTQVVPNAMTTSSQLRSGFGWVSVEFRSSIGIPSIILPHLETLGRQELRVWIMAYSPTETDLRPPVYDFDLADSEKIRIFAPWKKNRISTTATT